eukprot:316351-Rhodomonas_salina.3
MLRFLAGDFRACQTCLTLDHAHFSVDRLIANYREYSDGTATSTIADTFARQPDLASTCAMSVPGIA